MVKAKVPDVAAQRREVEMICQWLRSIVDAKTTDRSYGTVEVRLEIRGGVLEDVKLIDAVTRKPVIAAVLREKSRSVSRG